MLSGGEGAASDFGGVLSCGVERGREEIGVFFCELGDFFVRHAEHVGDDENLSIAACACADANRWDRDGGGDARGDGGGDAFEDDRKSSGFFERASVGDEAKGVLFVAALNLVSAHRVDGLREKSDVSEGGDASVHEATDHGGDLGSAFDFNPFDAPFLNEAAGIGEGLLGVQFIGHEGHIPNNERERGGAGDGGGVVDHHIERDPEGGLESERGHAE